MEEPKDRSGGSADPLEHSIFDVRSKEDQGVVAAEGFLFQYDCLSKCSIRMLGDDSLIAVVCETHEDAVLVFADGSAELVSCKARSDSKPYSVSALLTEGGVLHLFDRWDHTGRGCRTRLMTDGALSDGDPKNLAAACHSRDRVRVLPWAKRLAEVFDAPIEVVADFLLTLTIDNNDLRPRRRLAQIVSFNDLRRHLRAAKLDVTRDLDYYRLIRSAVHERCSTSAADPWDGQSLLDASLRPEAATDRARLEARMLTRQVVEACLFEDPPRAPIDARPDALDHTRMVMKLERGAVGPATVAAAKRLRAAWYEFESARRLRAPATQSGFEDLRARVLIVAADAESAIDRREPYGARLYADLRARLTPDAVGEAAVQGLTRERLLGLIFQLTDECELYWSAPFDIDRQAA